MAFSSFLSTATRKLQVCPSTTSVHVKDVLRDLKKSELVVVPTDKTNSFRTMDVERYKMEVIKHLSKSAIVIERAKLTKIYDNCSDKLNELQEASFGEGTHFSRREDQVKSDPTAQDPHQGPQEARPGWEFSHKQDWLVVPATNFTASFPKLGYMGIKQEYLRRAQH